MSSMQLVINKLKSANFSISKTKGYCIEFVVCENKRCSLDVTSEYGRIYNIKGKQSPKKYRGIDKIIKVCVVYRKNHKWVTKNAKERESNYNKETAANVAYKLKLVIQFIDGGNSLSKSARMAKIDYTTAKLHINGSDNK